MPQSLFFRQACVALILAASAMWVGAQPATPSAPSPAPATAPDSATTTQAQRQVEQPGNNAPTWREVRKEGQTHYSSLPARESGVLIQSAGETWRQLRNGPITFYGGWLIVLVAAAIGAFYLWRGTMQLHERPTGKLIARFALIERWAHWSMAISFCVLGVSGLVILFGKHLLLPVIGHTLFAWLTFLMKNLHNFVGPLFIISIVLFFIIYVRDNLPEKGDLQWLLKGGGMLNGEHVPSGRFNAGEKSWFWFGVVILGAVMSASGLVLLFPNFEQLRSTMQTANVVHGIAAVVFIAMSLGHIYVGTIGMEGAYQGMRTGYVDASWAKEHHALWYEEMQTAQQKHTTGTTQTNVPQAQH
jgi:formate dehydrogenase subunit gamma